MKILVTGTEGYLGCLLAPLLIADGHEVVAVDTGFYKNGWLYNGLESTPYTLDKDMRDLTVEDFDGVDAVVAMAGASLTGGVPVARAIGAWLHPAVVSAAATAVLAPSSLTSRRGMVLRRPSKNRLMSSVSMRSSRWWPRAILV